MDGEEVLSFSYPQSDSKYESIKEECYVRTKDNEYIIKELNVDDDRTEFICKINVENIKGNPFSHFETVEQTCTDAVNLALAGTGWTIGSCDVTKKRTVRKANCSSYDVLQEIRNIYRCDFKFDSINKKVYIYQSMGTDRGTYFSEELNLKKLGIQSNSYDFVTRIIPLGKDGLKITDINGGKEYIENYQYSNKIITVYWEDNRYTVAETLKEDAILKLNELSKPFKAYTADIIDLAKLNSKYSNILEYDLGDTITLLSKDKKVKEKQKIVKIIEYLDEPEKNTCEIANRTLRFEDMQSDTLDAVDTVDSITNSDGGIDGTKVDGIEYAKIRNVSIGTADIQDASIITAKIGNAQITTAKIADASISSAKIQDAAIDSAKIKDASITNAKIVNASIDSAKIQDGAITNAKIGDASITNAKIADASIDSAKIENGAITNVLIRNGAINTAQIADGSITDAKIVGMTANKITAGTIDAANIDVINLNCANLTVGTINGQQIASGAVDVENIANGAITTEKIAVGAITSEQLEDRSITGEKLALGSISSGNLNITNHLLY